MQNYPFVCPIQVRWRDLDAFAHVNNAVFASYLEVARTEFWRQRFGGRSTMEIPFFVRRLEIDFKRPISLDDEVQVWLRVGEMRGASFDFEYLVEADGSTAAVAVTTLACVDTTSGRPVRIAEDVRAILATLQVRERPG